MTSKRFGIAAVVDASGELVGALSDGDLRRAFRAGFADRPVSEAMGKRPCVITADLLERFQCDWNEKAGLKTL